MEEGKGFFGPQMSHELLWYTSMLSQGETCVERRTEQGASLGLAFCQPSMK